MCEIETKVMQFTLTVNCKQERGSFGFTLWDHISEVQKILKQAITHLENGKPISALTDSNGNLVGRFEFKDAVNESEVPSN